MIFRANQVIDHVPQIEMDATRQEEIILEAKFLRELAYLTLAQNFRQVPLVLTSQSEDLFPEKASREELWAKIEQDFSEARALPGSYPSGMVGYATS